MSVPSWNEIDAVPYSQNNSMFSFVVHLTNDTVMQFEAYAETYSGDFVQFTGEVETLSLPTRLIDAIIRKGNE